MEILPLFCEIDDFCRNFEQLSQNKALSDGKRRNRRTRLSQPEVLPILVMFHLSSYKNLKAFYLQAVLRRHSLDFPRLRSYRRVMPL
jgi:cytoskeletal protein RodZ